MTAKEEAIIDAAVIAARNGFPPHLLKQLLAAVDSYQGLPPAKPHRVFDSGLLTWVKAQ